MMIKKICSTPTNPPQISINTMYRHKDVYDFGKNVISLDVDGNVAGANGAYPTLEMLKVISELLLVNNLDIILLTSNGWQPIEDRLIIPLRNTFAQKCMQKLTAYTFTHGIYTTFSPSGETIHDDSIGDDLVVKEEKAQDIANTAADYLSSLLDASDSRRDLARRLLPTDQKNFSIPVVSGSEKRFSLQLEKRISPPTTRNPEGRCYNLALRSINKNIQNNAGNLRELVKLHLETYFANDYQIEVGGDSTINMFGKGAGGKTVALQHYYKQKPSHGSLFTHGHIGDEARIVGIDAQGKPIMGNDLIFNATGLPSSDRLYVLNTGLPTLINHAGYFMSKYEQALLFDIARPMESSVDACYRFLQILKKHNGSVPFAVAEISSFEYALRGTEYTITIPKHYG